MWKLLSIGSKNTQLNSITFSKGYWSAVVTKLCYSLFMVPLKDRNREELDKAHINIAKKGTRFTTKCASNSATSYIKIDKINHLHRKRSFELLWAKDVLINEVCL